MNKRYLKTLKDLYKRSKGLPVGLVITAKKLVHLGLCEWAPPFWGGKHLAELNSRRKRKYSPIRLTTLGNLYAEGVL